MPGSVLDKIKQGWILLNEGKEEDALDLVAKIEKKENLSPEEKLKNVILKGNIHYSLGNIQIGLKLAEETYEEYEKLGIDFLLIDAIILKLWFLLYQGQVHSKSFISLLDRGKIIFKSISNRTPREIANKEARFLYLTGVFHFNKGNFNNAMECLKRVLKLIDEFKIDNQEEEKYRRYVLSMIGHTYTNKGELNLALEYHEKSLALKIGDTRLEKIKNLDDFWGMGYLFYLKGDLDKSLEFFNKSLAILEEFNWLVNHAPNSGTILVGLIRTLIAKGDHNGTQKYLNLFKEINDKNPIEMNILNYNMLRAKTLKSSTRPRDRAEAEKVFKEIIEKEEKIPHIVNASLTELCDLYMNELKLTSDITIIDEIYPYLSRLQEVAEKENSYPILARTKLLEARIALVQMNLGDARRFLTEAQEIADENGYQHLAQTISIEHDNLLNQLDVWKNLKEINAPVSKRMNLASFTDSVEDLLEMKDAKKPELLKEQPVLLLILMEGGILLLSYQFADEWKSNDELFGSFLTAFMSFSSEFFTEGLDRAKFGEYTVLMETISKYSICYLYKGQTYLAKKKLGYFIERLQTIPSIMQTLDKFTESSQVIELKKFPFLEGFITEIFISKNPGNISI